MKFKKFLILFVATFFFSFLNVEAFSTSLGGKNEVNINENITININLSGLSETGLASAQYYLTYDSSKLQYVSYSVGQGKPSGDFNVSNDGSKVILLYLDNSGTDNALKNGTFATITFKTKTLGQASFSLSGKGFSTFDNGIVSLSTNNASKNIDIVTPTTTTTTKKVTTTSATTKKTNTTTKPTTTKKVDTTTTKKITTNKIEKETTTVAKNNSLLKTLIIENVNFVFDKNTFEYTVEVENDVERLNISYEAEDRNAKVEKNGNEELVVGENTIELIVTNEKAKTIYILNIIRKDNVVEIGNNEAEILEALKQDTDILTIKVDINDANKIVTSNILKYLKDNKKDILYEVYENNKIIYSVKILGENIEDTNEINFNIKFNSNYKNNLSEQLKDYNYKIINFDYRGSLVKDTEVTIYNIVFEDKVYLYNYNNTFDEINFIKELDNNNNIKLLLDETGEYVITDYVNNSNYSTILFVVLLILFIIICILLTLVLVMKNKKKKNVF